MDFKQICAHAGLGAIVGVPESLSGGLLHKIYAIETISGKYVVKLLNPEIINRLGAKHNYRQAESIAEHASRSVPTLAAKRINGTFLQVWGDHHYLLYDWIVGRSLTNNEVTAFHSEKVGSILGRIHSLDFSHLELTDHCTNIEVVDWDFYRQHGEKHNAEWWELFHFQLSQLHEWNARAVRAGKILITERVVSHRDLDAKNVMWHQGEPVIFDWESAGCVHPMCDFMETALYWSENNEGSVEIDRLRAFIRGYERHRPRLDTDWETVLEHGFSGKLDWLEYNLKRSLKMGFSDEEEQKLGTAQVIKTLRELKHYAAAFPVLLKWL
ncbi:phosphotransferase [Halobacillus litoralis]|uniref:phosphotransferase n=1 Tax=Halobacillus litoralis TaxID=45668 RepID=UPI001CFE64A0|nr:phosphotransferase [Halobacillus litoralis]